MKLSTLKENICKLLQNKKKKFTNELENTKNINYFRSTFWTGQSHSRELQVCECRRQVGDPKSDKSKTNVTTKDC